jgi:hypothetical protein
MLSGILKWEHVPKFGVSRCAFRSSSSGLKIVLELRRPEEFIQGNTFEKAVYIQGLPEDSLVCQYELT